jgi:hypothetical protein
MEAEAMHYHTHRAVRMISLALILATGAPASSAEDAAAPRDDLEAQVAELIRMNREMREEIESLTDRVRVAEDDALAARRLATSTPRSLPDVAQAPPPSGLARESMDGAIVSRQVGRANFQLLDISLDTQASFGWSSADDDELQVIQGGGHDPRRRGFNLQQVELGLSGAVDPYFSADVFLVYFLDPEGESRFELEEAFATTQMLPFGLEEAGFQVEVGQFYTEYGRWNPLHPHAWDWQDQPIVNTRFFGGDGLRNPGVRVGWLAPVPWFSELHLGAQSSQGETAVSFFANEEVFEERPIGGRPFDSPGTQGLGDLLYLTRWVNGFDIGEEWSAQWGVSGLFGPNATGGGGRTYVAGTDLVLKWLPLSSDRGWPRFAWETEFSHRWYDADRFVGCPEDVEPCGDPALPGDTLRDWGLVTKLVWGFRRGWDVGVRYEYASGSGSDVSFRDDPDPGLQEWVRSSRNSDPFRDDRHRVSPLLVFYPSEFSRLRLQYNYDRVKHGNEPNVHTGWFGAEFLFGAHSAHGY